MLSSRYIRRAEVSCKDEQTAIDELAHQLDQDQLGGVVLFCSPVYDQKKLAAAINNSFHCPVIGCTTAGEIGSTYSSDGIVGASFSSEVFRFHSVVIDHLDTIDFKSINAAVCPLQNSLEFSDRLDPAKTFGFLLIDGLSLMTETVAASLYSATNGIHIIGGSAGGRLDFKETHVFDGNKFVSNAAVFSLIETKLPFKPFKLQHFAPSDKEMVTTEADSSRRIVYEINGEPATQEYADIIGVPVDKLTSQVFAMHPVMLQIGNDWYVRSIKNATDDGALTFFCAIDNGLPLTVGKGIGFTATLREKVKEIQAEFPSIEMTLGADCILRRIEISENNNHKEVEAELSKIKFMGFSSFGEQFNAIHVNQTLVGIVFGSEPQA
ncbi:MAG: hypothetical protein EOL87_10265 [Spartobacteria bacterium]|nr:hypothetical protein [Spartobacteria bacterium]